MPTINYYELGENLHKLIEKLNDDHKTLCLEFADYMKAIILSDQDYNSLTKTIYLLSNSVNTDD